MNELKNVIATKIRTDGPMDIGSYMALALGHPQHGYYMKRDPLGTAGDFTTAPEISQMFGEMIGAWIADAWLRAGAPAPFTLAEAGPGRGTLMADMLRATRSVPGFHRSMRLHLLETGLVLRAKQKAALAGHDPCWHDDAVSFLAAGEGPLFMVANEFLDALPLRQFRFTKGRWEETVIAVDGNGALVMDSIAADFAVLPDGAAEGDIWEVAPVRERFMTQLAVALKQRGGAALLIDYGHAVSGPGDTLQAVMNHRFVPVLSDPGNADLTSHVDFAALKRVAESHCTAHGPVQQGDFLRRLGIGVRAAQLNNRVNDPHKHDIDAALARLVDDAQMGRLFKVMALTHSPVKTVEGFLS